MIKVLENYSNKAVQIIDEAKRIADEYNSKIVGSEHLLLALYEAKDSVCSFLLSERFISKEDIMKEIEDLIILRNMKNESIYTKELTDIVKYASSLTVKMKSDYVYEEHLFYAMLTSGDNVGKDVLTRLGVDIEELILDIEDMFNLNDEEKKHPFTFLTNLSMSNKPHPYHSKYNVYLYR
jgi:ATP-dependent Clp protease ATP-binding subunit ClpC